MSRANGLNRYSLWDGSQQNPIDAQAIMAELTDDLMEYGDLRWAMRNLLSKGMTMPQGGSLQGLRDMLKQLRAQKQAQLQRYNLDGLFDNFRQRLEKIEQAEQQRIDQWLTGDSSNGQDADSDTKRDTNSFTSDIIKNIAKRNQDQLQALPSELPARVKALEQYEFLNPDAQKDFLELLNELRRAVAKSFFKDVENMVQQLSDGDLERMKAMLKALNDMLVKKIAGQDPGFDEFMAQFGDMFGTNPPDTLDELLAQMRQQMAAAQSLMNSLSDEQRTQLGQLMGDRLGDSQLQAELAKFGKEMDFLNPEGGQYNFSGDESLELQDAMRMMSELQDMDALSDQLQQAQRAGKLDNIDKDLLQQLLGEDAAENLDNLDQLMQALADAGYIQPGEGNRWEVTPRGSRMIGQQALGEIYNRLKRQNLGNHAAPEEGLFGERLEQTKEYEFGDAFQVHMPRTLRNAIARNGPQTPIQLQPQDFEVYRSEMITSTATVLLVDLSWSMALRGSFQAAKKVALALHNLITSQYPKDSFYIIGFAAYAKELKPKDLPFLQWDEYVLGTNMQHALLLAEKKLAKHQGGSKQIIMISDGEPTAHIEDGEAQFAYPPTAQTIRATFRAVKHCTTRGIAINSFMLESSEYLRAFMNEMARINGGRVFYTSPDELGEYILVDYVQHKRKKLARR